jgi:hypothetical protein
MSGDRLIKADIREFKTRLNDAEFFINYCRKELDAIGKVDRPKIKRLSKFLNAYLTGITGRLEEAAFNKNQERCEESLSDKYKDYE